MSSTIPLPPCKHLYNRYYSNKHTRCAIDTQIGVLESKWDPIRQKLVRRLLEEQDKMLLSYFAQKGRAGQRVYGKGRVHVKWDMYA
jgi:hypothetical protein